MSANSAFFPLLTRSNSGKISDLKMSMAAALFVSVSKHALYQLYAMATAPAASSVPSGLSKICFSKSVFSSSKTLNCETLVLSASMKCDSSHPPQEYV